LLAVHAPWGLYDSISANHVLVGVLSSGPWQGTRVAVCTYGVNLIAEA